MLLIFFIVLIGLSLLILGHEAGHFFVAKFFKLRVDEFGIGFPPRIFARKRGETEYSVNWLPFGGFVRIAGEDQEDAPASPDADKSRYFFARPAYERALVVAAGVIINFVLGWFLISAVLMVGTPSLLAVSAVDPGSPAAAAGLKAGDIVKNFSSADTFISTVQKSGGEPLPLTVLRDGKEVEVKVVPQGEANKAKIGVSLEEGGAPRMNPLSALGAAFKISLKICLMTLQAFYELAKNLLVRASLLEGVVGPVGIFSVAQQTGQFGMAYLFQLLGMISLNLAVANLIPFPALDGGRLFLILVEKIKGSPVSKRAEGWLNGVGFVFLILIMVLVTARDVANWFR